MEAEPRVCPSCHKNNDPVLTACWKCGALLDEKSGAENPKSSNSLQRGLAVVAAVVLLVVLIVLSRKLLEFFSHNGKNTSAEVSEVRPAAAPRSSGVKQSTAASRNGLVRKKVPTDLIPIEAEPIVSDTGDYGFLVAALPAVVSDKASVTGYFQKFIEDYLRSHTGSTLLAENELMFREKYPAVEYKIGYEAPKRGRTGPCVRHAITAVIEGKAYTAFVNYSKDFEADDETMKKNLTDLLPAV